MVKLKHFKATEFKMGNKQVFSMMDWDFLLQLDFAREFSGDVKFIILSSYRTPEYNKKVGGVEDSAHIKGLAVDIRALNSHEVFQIVSALIIAGFRRIGINYERKFIHVDKDEEKSQDVMFPYINKIQKPTKQ